MTVQLPDELAKLIRGEVLKGQFASDQDLVIAAVVDYLRTNQTPSTRSSNAVSGDVSHAAPSTQELQRRLFEAGVISEIKAPIADLTPYRVRQAVPISGEPISQTVIRERR